MSYRVWLRLGPERPDSRREILSAVRKLGRPPKNHTVLVSDSQRDLYGLLMRRGGFYFYWDDGRVVLKPVVRIVSDKREARSNSAERITVQVGDAPPQYSEIGLRVSDQRLKLARGDTLRVGWDQPTAVRVDLDEPFLRADRPLYLKFT